jgi:hypothetical protein
VIWIVNGPIYCHTPEKMPHWDGRAVNYRDHSTTTFDIGTRVLATEVPGTAEDRWPLFTIIACEGRYKGWGAIVSLGNLRSVPPLELLAMEAE